MILRHKRHVLKAVSERAIRERTPFAAEWTCVVLQYVALCVSASCRAEGKSGHSGGGEEKPAETADQDLQNRKAWIAAQKTSAVHGKGSVEKAERDIGEQGCSTKKW